MPDAVNKTDAAAELEGRVVYQPFFAKLASYGIVPSTQEEAERLFTLGLHLREHYGNLVNKEAQARSSVLDSYIAEVSGAQPRSDNDPSDGYARAAATDSQLLSLVRSSFADA